MVFLGGLETTTAPTTQTTTTTTRETPTTREQQLGQPSMATSSSSSKPNNNHHHHHQLPSFHHHHPNHDGFHHQNHHQHHQNQLFLHHPNHQNQQHHQNQNISFAMMPSPPSSSSSLPPPNYIDGGGSSSNPNKENTAGPYDLGELDQALFLYLDGQSADHPPLHPQNQNSTTSGGGGMRPPTLNIFPSQPMHVEPSSKANSGVLAGGGGGVGGGVQSTTGGGSKRLSEQPQQQQQPQIELSNNNNNIISTNNNNNNNNGIINNNNNKTRNQSDAPAEPSKCIKRERNRKGPTSSSEQEGPKTPDPKTLRRLAQNREAARKSRLRKKAYVQQLESSRIRLAQLEQELQRARAQGIFFGGGGGLVGGGGDQGIPVGVANISSDAAVFDLEYTRWLEEHHRLTCELRAAVQEHIPENELKIYVDNCLGHYDVVMNLKSMVAKTDVFHLVSGMWKTPAERCFLWIGGFRPSELIKIILHQIEPLTEQQLMDICGLQQSAQGTEEALSQGLDTLNQSLSDVIASDSLSCPPNMANYMGQMALAMNKLSTMENFVRQADSLRHQTFHRLHQILTTRQAARCFLAIAEYFHRLRALSSLWMARPRQE